MPRVVLLLSAPAALDSVFGLVHASGARSLVLDLRGNGGGVDEYGALLLSYLTDRYPELSSEKLQELRTLGERFAQPPKRQATTAA